MSVAGPFIQIAFGVAVYFIAARLLSEEAPRYAHVAVSAFVFVSVIWGALNLSPVLPLDGGNILRSGLDWITKGRGAFPAYIISAITGAGLCALGISYRMWFAAAMAGFFVYRNARSAMEHRSAAGEERFAPDLQRAVTALRAADHARVLAIVEPILREVKSKDMRAEALHLAAFAHLVAGRVEEADKLVATLPSGVVPHPDLLRLRGEVVAERGQQTGGF